MDLIDMAYGRTCEFKNKIFTGDAKDILAKKIPSEEIDVCVTSPPYYKLRDYGVNGQLGQEHSVEEYISNLVEVFKEVKRVLKPEGTLWVNIDDTYINKQLSLVPQRFVIAMQQNGWLVRSDNIWEKANCIPESVRDRTSRIHEYIFMFSKSKNYYYDKDAIMIPMKESSIKRMKNGRGHNTKYNKSNKIYGQSVQAIMKPINKDHDKEIPSMCNKKSVWTIPTSRTSDTHFAAYSPELIRPCIKACCPKGGIVLDPFLGTGTTAVVALQEGMNFSGIELNPKFVEISLKNISFYRKQIGKFDITSLI